MLLEYFSLNPVFIVGFHFKLVTDNMKKKTKTASVTFSPVRRAQIFIKFEE